MMALDIPPATRRRFAQVPGPGEGRHNHARDISFALIGEGWPESEVFALLRPLYDSGTFRDAELEAIISGARKRNPQRARRDGMCHAVQRPHAPPRHDEAPAPTPPTLRAPTRDELRRIEAVRRIGAQGVNLCASRGQLWCGSVCGFASWMVADATRRGMQARRLDGKPYPETGTLGERKTHNPAGTSTRHPVGFPLAQGARAVLLVEGSADLVAAHHFIWCEGREADACAVAMLGAGLAIPDEDLPAFAGLRVRIFPHTDPEGMEACERWAAQLSEAGANVDAFSLSGLRREDGAPVNDLNDLNQIHPDDFEANRTLWSLIP